MQAKKSSYLTEVTIEKGPRDRETHEKVLLLIANFQQEKYGIT
jgi:hypothetical protein